MPTRLFAALAVLVLAVLAIPSASLAKEAAKLKFGLLLVGPYNDRGWSQAHYEGGKYVEQKFPGAQMIYIDKVNPADRAGVTVPQLVDDLVAKGCTLIIANSDDMKDGTAQAALDHPTVKFVHISGDHAIDGKGPKNLANLMGRMEYGKMMAGFAAALTTQTGKIGYLGPLVNEETRRLAAATYLGARYAWEKVLGKNPKDLKFSVTWIGFWFNIPGVTADPSQVAQNFFNTGADVVISGIDTTEAVTVAQQKRKEGKQAWAVPYDFEGACDGAAESCLGVPYYNWGPDYLALVKATAEGKWAAEWRWVGPDWANINDHDKSAIGFKPGPALAPDVKAKLDAFVRDLGTGKVNLFQGPLAYQDGTAFVKAGAAATDREIWYMKQLLQGMEGQSSAK